MPVPADPKRPYKAYVATALSALSVFVAAWVADTDPFTAKEIGAALVAAIVGSGLTGVTTFAVANPAKRDSGWKVNPGEAGAGEVDLLVRVVCIVLLVVLVVWLLSALL